MTGKSGPISRAPSLESTSESEAELRHRRMMLDAAYELSKVSFEDVPPYSKMRRPLVVVKTEDMTSFEIANTMLQDVRDSNTAMERHVRNFMMAELKYKHRISDDEELKEKYPREYEAIRSWALPEEQKEIPAKAIHALGVISKNSLPVLFKKFGMEGGLDDGSKK